MKKLLAVLLCALMPAVAFAGDDTIFPPPAAKETQASPNKQTTAPAAPAKSSGEVPAKPNTLLDGTPVKLRIGRNVSSADAKVGEHVDFEVLEDVQVMGTVVIAKGANASATVTEAQPKRRMGREGKLDMTLDYVRLADNEKAALTATAGGKGGSNVGKMTGAIVATAVFTLGGSALFLLMHGKDITIPKGAETTAYINGDMQLDMSKFGVAPTAQTSAQASPTTSPVQASLSIDSAPTGADIEIDGAFVGNTPSTIVVTLGSHQIAIKKKGFADWTKTLNVSGGTIHLDAELDAEPAKQ
jgi:PEGA domain